MLFEKQILVKYSPQEEGNYFFNKCWVDVLRALAQG